MTRWVCTGLLLLLVAVPARAQTTVGGPWARIVFGADSGPTIRSGTGSPEGVVTAGVGSIYLRTDGGAGTSVYMKESGSGATGWVGVGAGGGGSTHNLLSATHTDTVAGAPVVGAVPCANGTPAWTRCTPVTPGQGLFFLGGATTWSADGTGLNVSATNLTMGVVPAARMPALTGDVTSSAGTVATTIAPDVVTYGKLQNVSAASRLLCRGSAGGAGDPEECSIGAGLALTGTVLSATGTGGAPTDAAYLTRTAESGLSNESNLGALTTGLLKITVAAGSATPSTATAGTDYVVPAGNVATATALAANGANCAAGQYPLGVDASGAVEGCTAAGGGGGGNRLLGITIDGAGQTITTGVKGFVLAPIAGTITAATLLSTDASATACSIVIDVWKDTYANYPPTDLDSITASAPPTLSSATKSQDTTLTGWTTAVTAGTVYGFNVDSVTSCTRVTLMLTVQP